MQVMTIIANPATKNIDDTIINHLSTSLKGHNLVIGPHEWLAENEACDVFFEGEHTPDLQEDVITEAQNLQCDIVIQPVDQRKKRLLIADMDSTMITVECIDELADFAGIKDQIAVITEKAMNGELDFDSALKERVALLKGLSADALEKAYNERITFTPGAKALVQTMRKAGATCILVSGGFTFFTSRVAEALGFHHQKANDLEIKDNALTGNVILPILGKEAKLENLNHYIKELGITRDNVLAVGDGANDLPMLQAAGLGVAFHAKPHVQKEAHTHINHNDLSALLYIQGYKKQDFVTQS